MNKDNFSAFANDDLSTQKAPMIKISVNSTYNSSCSLPISLLTRHPYSSSYPVKFYQCMRRAPPGPYLTQLHSSITFAALYSSGAHTLVWLPPSFFAKVCFPSLKLILQQCQTPCNQVINVSSLNRISPGISKHEPVPNIQACCTQSPMTQQSQEHLWIPLKGQSVRSRGEVGAIHILYLRSRRIAFAGVYTAEIKLSTPYFKIFVLCFR
ncbi:uncharacterized protein F5147DRAFT_761958 [Suillus discolor]|uniref:Uncharacterized protein n=1 Tax=Suillus discolor TaxID=1912936 RepID=A0A9P7F5G1_9AGAM|nr:uncharacterized protein F5147DRAFT_761958 [Suillus discolor]KAG2105540.1 hypothetical protein F5147DRAFT_761958 [Suillus discolor]